MGVCQFFLLNRPDAYPIWYLVVMPILLIARYAHFKNLGFQYFLIDFCYFVVSSSLVNILLLKSSPIVFKVLFIHGTGPLTLAIPVWRNSFVFHDFDKIVSVYIHILPCLLYYTLRWHGASVFGAAQEGLCGAVPCEPLTVYDYGAAIVMYIGWQAMYLVKTEYLDKSKLDNNPKLLTSLRWMASDTKNALAVSVLKFLKKVRVFGKDESYDSGTMKTKLVFVASQLVYTLVAFLPTSLMYNSRHCHLIYILLIVVNSVFNGASFYIEVFSKRYSAHITKIEEMQRIAKAAANVAEEIAVLQKQEEEQSAGDQNAESTATAGGVKEAVSFDTTSDGAAPAGGAPSPANGGAVGSPRGSNTEGLSLSDRRYSRQELAALADQMQQTSEDAWKRMIHHAEEAEELRRTYSGDFLSQYNDAYGDADDPADGYYHDGEDDDHSGAGSSNGGDRTTIDGGIGERASFDSAGSAVLEVLQGQGEGQPEPYDSSGDLHLLEELERDEGLRSRERRALTIDK